MSDKEKGGRREHNWGVKQEENVTKVDNIWQETGKELS